MEQELNRLNHTSAHQIHMVDEKQKKEELKKRCLQALQLKKEKELQEKALKKANEEQRRIIQKNYQNLTNEIIRDNSFDPEL